MQSELFIDTIEINNVKGVSHIRFKASSLNVLEGSNGEGKSSVLDAIAAVFQGGHDPGLLRLGEKKAEVVITLTDGSLIRKQITEKSSKLEFVPKDGAPIPAPQTFVDSLASGFSFNPLGLISCDPKKRIEYILSAMPIRFEPGELIATGIDGAHAPVDLDGLASIRDGIYESRKVLNKAVRDAEGTVVMLQKSLPDDDQTDWHKKWRELESESADIESQLLDAERAAEAEFSEAGSAIAKWQDGLLAELERKIAEVRSEATRKIDEARGVKEARLKRIAEVAKPERDRLMTEKSAAWERSQQQAKATGTRDSIDKMRAKIRENFIESERLTKVLGDLDNLRKAKLDSLPIEGIEFRNGEVFVGGVNFDRLNTAAKVIMSVKLAKLKLGRLPLLVVDQAECLDEETWPAFCEAIKESGLQMITARVSHGSLRVTDGTLTVARV